MMMSKAVKSPIHSQFVRNEPTLSNVIKILKSQETKLVTISTNLWIYENKTDSIMAKLEELTLDMAGLRKENCEFKFQIDILQVILWTLYCVIKAWS